MLINLQQFIVGRINSFVQPFMLNILLNFFLTTFQDKAAPSKDLQYKQRIKTVLLFRNREDLRETHNVKLFRRKMTKFDVSIKICCFISINCLDEKSF